jgi:hypothetical protein
MKTPLEDLFSGPVWCVYVYLDVFVIAFATKEMAKEYVAERPEEGLDIRSLFVYTTVPPVEPPPDYCKEEGCIKKTYGLHNFAAGCPGWPWKNAVPEDSKERREEESP